MNETTRIRSATSEDLRYLASIESKASEMFPHGRIPDPTATCPAERLETAMANGLLYVAELNGTVVGFATCREAGAYLHLDEMSVHPDHGRQGIGSALATRVIRESVDRSLDGVTLTTFEDIEWNAPFYSRLGFRRLAPDTLPKHVRHHLDEEIASGLTGRVGMLYRHAD